MDLISLIIIDIKRSIYSRMLRPIRAILEQIKLFQQQSLSFRKLWGYCLSLIVAHNGFTASVDTCVNASLFDLSDRGSVTKTPCTLTENSIMFEAGYQYQTFKPEGIQRNFIQPVFFVGLPERTEIFVELPDYNQLSIDHLSGYSGTVLGAKHEIGYGQNWVAAAAAFLMLPSGSPVFGNQGVGAKIHGILKYSIDHDLAIILMLGGSTETEPSFFKGGRFNNFLPSLMLTYAPTEKINTFVELFGQTKTDYVRGGNYNADCGFFYLLTPNVAFDLEVGQQLSNETGSFNRFINGGITIKM